jgi:hypothetical protein
MAKPTPNLPVSLERAVRRFEKWRRTRRRGEHIPEDLWELAARLAGKYGVNRTALPLRLDYYDLKRRVEAAVRQRVSRKKSKPAFVELVAQGQSTPTECMLELENADGAKIRIELRGTNVSDLAALARSLWREEA